MKTFGNIELLPNEEIRKIDYIDCRSGEHVKDERKYVSNYGRIFSLTNTVRLIKPQTQNAGYTIVNVAGKCRTLHRVVAHMFIERTEEDIKNGRNEIDHINHDKSNNTVENLRWLNRKENTKSDNHNNTSVPILCVDMNGNIINKYRSIRDAAIQINGSWQLISQCVRGLKNSYRGFIWIADDLEFEKRINVVKERFEFNYNQLF